MNALIRQIAAGLLLGTATAAAAMDEARESLLENSPFVPYSEPKPEPPPPPPPPPVVGNLSRELVFNGVLDVGGDTYFSIFDKSLNQSLLLKQGEEGHRFSIVRFSADGDRTIQVKSGNRVETISLASSDGSPIPTSTPAPANAAKSAAERLRQHSNIRPPKSESGSSSSGRRREIPRRRIIPRRSN